jgi:AcrR family transcriptional regulator
MTEITANRGYAGVTVRETARVAGVSSRSFYKLFKGKDDCFFATYDWIVDRAVRQIAAVQVGENDGLKALRLALGTLTGLLQSDPLAARLVLVEAYSAGPHALARIRRTESLLKAMILVSFESRSERTAVSPMVIEGMAAGAIHVARTQLLTTDYDFTPDALGDELTEWMFELLHAPVADLPKLDRRTVSNGVQMYRPEPGEVDMVVDQADNERALFLSAVAKLVMAEKSSRPTVQGILRATGLSRRSFETHFSSADECLLAMLESRGRNAICDIFEARRRACSPVSGAYLAISAFCEMLASDPLLARICIVDTLVPGNAGRQCRERFTRDLAAATFDVSSPASPKRLFAEASVGAVYGVIRHYVRSERTHQLPENAAAIAVLGLGPIAGWQAVAAAIENQQVD